jgi:7-cyano-7-deazaguanine synthase
MTSIVTLVSGGLDSTLLAALTAEEGRNQYPLFIDYGQRSSERELNACRTAMTRLNLPAPRVANLSGFGSLIRSGLTDRSLDVKDDAFTPGRNSLFLLVAGSYAMQVGASAVAIGLLDERFHLFPDQARSFLKATEEFLYSALGYEIAIVAPLMTMSKSDVVLLAKSRNISSTYSCHAGEPEPCGRCIACLEFEGTEA